MRVAMKESTAPTECVWYRRRGGVGGGRRRRCKFVSRKEGSGTYEAMIRYPVVLSLSPKQLLVMKPLERVQLHHTSPAGQWQHHARTRWYYDIQKVPEYIIQSQATCTYTPRHTETHQRSLRSGMHSPPMNAFETPPSNHQQSRHARPTDRASARIRTVSFPGRKSHTSP